MPKTKSPKTIEKEEALKKSVEMYLQAVKLTAAPKLKFKLLPGKVKSTKANVVVRNAQLKPDCAAFFIKLKKALIEEPQGYGPYLKLNEGSYLFGVNLKSLGDCKNVLIISPSMTVFKEKELTVEGHTYTVVREDETDPIDVVADHHFTDEAVAMTWPNELGKVKFYMHKSSVIAKYNLTVYVPNPEGINRDALKNVTEWDVLADYILLRDEIGITPSQKAICDMVKIISTNRSAEELTAMKQSAGGI